MLVSAAQVQEAMTLSRAAIVRALGNAGYGGGSDITEVQFKGFNGTGFVYEITYVDPENEGEDGEEAHATGSVFVQLKRRPFSDQFDFYAEY